MQKLNKVRIEADEDGYNLFIDGVMIKGLTYLNINKTGEEPSHLSVQMNCEITTKESN